MISAGTEMARGKAYEYVTSISISMGKPRPGDPTIGGQDDKRSRAKFDETVTWLKAAYPELFPPGASIGIAGPVHSKLLSAEGLVGKTYGQSAYVHENDAALIGASETSLTDTIAHEILHTYVNREMGQWLYYARELLLDHAVHTWIGEKATEIAKWREELLTLPMRPVVAPPRPSIVLPENFRR